MTPKEIYEAVKKKSKQWSALCGECNDFNDGVNMTLHALEEVLEGQEREE